MSSQPNMRDEDESPIGHEPPSDEPGLSLDELSQAYAALLKRGGDPDSDSASFDLGQHPQPGRADEEPAADSLSDENSDVPVTPRGILEAILFVGHPAGEALSSERIAALMRGVRPAEIDDLVTELNDQYAAEGAPYAIVSTGPGYQMTLRLEFGPLRDALLGRVREARLSQAAIDVLAIVAYNQPIAASEIDRLRGKPSASILAQLVRRDLLALSREGSGPAKSQYSTTPRFLHLFALQSVSELPHSLEVDREL
jgi:segregation and condensation protein B